MFVVRAVILLGFSIVVFAAGEALARVDRRLPGERLLETDPLAGPAIRSLTIEEFGWRSIGEPKKNPVGDKPAQSSPPSAENADTAIAGPPAFMREDHNWPYIVSFVTAGKPAVALPSMARPLSPASPVLAFGVPAFLEDADIFASAMPAQPPAPFEGDAKPPPARIPVAPRIADIAAVNLAETQMFVSPKPLMGELQRLGISRTSKVIGAIAEMSEAAPIVAAVSFLETGFVPVGDAEGFEPDAALARLRLRRNSFRLNEKIVWLAPPRLTPEAGRASYCYGIISEEGAESGGICEAWALGRHGAVMVSFAPVRAPEGAPEPTAAVAMLDAATRWLDAIGFEAGESYADFDPRRDRVAALLAEDLIETGQDAPTIPAIRLRIMFSGLWRLLFLVVLALASLFVIGFLWFYARRRRRSAGPERSADGPSHPPAIFARAAQKLRRFGLQARDRTGSAPVNGASAFLKKYVPTLTDLLEKTGGLPHAASVAAPVSAPSLPVKDARSSPLSPLEKYLPTLDGLVRRARGDSNAAAQARARDADEDPGKAAIILSERMAAVRKRTAMAPQRISPVSDAAPTPERYAQEPTEAGEAAETLPVGPDTPSLSLLSDPASRLRPDPDLLSEIAESAEKGLSSPSFPAIDLIEPGDNEAARAIQNARRQRNASAYSSTGFGDVSDPLAATPQGGTKDPGTTI
jgi:uncharacterized membrane-anchored protein